MDLIEGEPGYKRGFFDFFHVQHHSQKERDLKLQMAFIKFAKTVGMGRAVVVAMGKTCHLKTRVLERKSSSQLIFENHGGRMKDGEFSWALEKIIQEIYVKGLNKCASEYGVAFRMLVKKTVREGNWREVDTVSNSVDVVKTEEVGKVNVLHQSENMIEPLTTTFLDEKKVVVEEVPKVESEPPSVDSSYTYVNKVDKCLEEMGETIKLPDYDVADFLDDVKEIPEFKKSESLTLGLLGFAYPTYLAPGLTEGDGIKSFVIQEGCDLNSFAKLKRKAIVYRFLSRTYGDVRWIRDRSEDGDELFKFYGFKIKGVSIFNFKIEFHVKFKTRETIMNEEQIITAAKASGNYTKT